MSVKVQVSASQYVNSYGTGQGVYFMTTMGIVSVVRERNGFYAIKDGSTVTNFTNGTLSQEKSVIHLRTNVGNYSWRIR